MDGKIAEGGYAGVGLGGGGAQQGAGAACDGDGDGGIVGCDDVAVLIFDLGDDGRILLDASGDTVKVVANPDSDDADTTLTLTAANLAKLMEGDLNPMVAFTMGRLKISGSKGVAWKLSSLLDK